MRPSSLAVIGLGAIGGSVAWQARSAGIARVVGFSSDPADALEAVKAGAVSEWVESPERAVRGAELVVLAVPPRATIDLLDRLAPRLESGALLTDVASVKAPVVARARAAGLADRFAGAHPLTGSHGSGFVNARPDRFAGCVVYVCETGGAAGAGAARAVAGFWEQVLAAEPVWIDAEQHDRQLAWTSHLPQAVASALAAALASAGFAGVSYGPGARDTTRLAASSPRLWVEVLLQNAGPVTGALGAMESSLAELRRFVEANDESGLERYLATAAEFRRGIDR